MVTLTVLVALWQFVSTLDLQTGLCLEYCWVETTVLAIWTDARPQSAITLEGLGWLHPPQAISQHPTHTYRFPFVQIPFFLSLLLVLTAQLMRIYARRPADRSSGLLSNEFQKQPEKKLKVWLSRDKDGSLTFVTGTALLFLGKV